MPVRTMTLADALAVASAMRDDDRQCLRALTGSDDPEAFAAGRWAATGPAWTLTDADGRPLAVFGLSLPTDWQAVAWLVAAEGLQSHSWRELIRHARTVAANVIDPAHPQYRHRVEAHVMSAWPAARRFARSLGFVHEGTRRGAGCRGEDFEVWAIVGPVKG